MPQVNVFKEDYDVAHRLSLFNVTREEILMVVELAAGGRADAVPNDPPAAGGQFSYIYGTRGLREVFIPKGWDKDDKDNVASVIHPESGMKLIFQNVDLACNENKPPKAISGKGPAAKRIVNQSMAYLFDYMEKNIRTGYNRRYGFFVFQLWGDDVRAELSLPLGIRRRQFNGFAERIFILRRGAWNPTVIVTSKTDVSPIVQDYEVQISRK